jgi:hypothetical protein
MIKSMRMAVAGLAVAAGATAFGYGFEGTFDDIAAYIAESVAGEDPAALKIQNFIEKDSDRLSKDFVTFAKVAKAAAKDEFNVLDEETLYIEFFEMVARSEEFAAEVTFRMEQAILDDPLHAARIIAKQARAALKQAKFLEKVSADLDDGNLAKAAVHYAAIQKLFEALDRAFPAPG